MTKLDDLQEEINAAIQLERAYYCPFGKWIATPYNSLPRSWSIIPKSFFERFGKIPDWHVGCFVDYLPGWSECANHIIQYDDTIVDPKQSLIDAGFEIVEDPVWYFNRSNVV